MNDDAVSVALLRDALIGLMLAFEDVPINGRQWQALEDARQALAQTEKPTKP